VGGLVGEVDAGSLPWVVQANRKVRKGTMGKRKGTRGKRQGTRGKRQGAREHLDERSVMRVFLGICLNLGNFCGHVDCCEFG
jgi:hypothetical protein